MKEVKGHLKMLITFAVIMSMAEALSYCSYGQFRCFNGKCVASRYFCNNVDSCGDNSDEMYCDEVPVDGCLIDEGVERIRWLRCKDMGRCYPFRLRCDGQKNCADGSDEDGCVQKITGVREAKRDLTKQILEIKYSRETIHKQITDLLKAAIALQLAEPFVFAPGNETGKVITYGINLHLMTKELKKETFTTDELSLLISALLASCTDPRNVFGMDLVQELRRRVANSNDVNPFSILTLCNAEDAMTEEDVNKILRAFNAYRRHNSTDTQAVATMALACLSAHNISTEKEALNNMTAELKRKQHPNGSIGDSRTTALVLQALIATKSHQHDFNLTTAIKFLLREISKKRTDDAFYILPVFSTMSFADISSYFCRNSQRNEFAIIKDTEDKSKKYIQARLSLAIGNDMNFVRCWKLTVPANESFYQLLETFGSLEPQYKVEYSVSDGKPYVRKVAKSADDVATGTFWFTHTRILEADSKPEVRVESPVDIQVEENTEFILWYKSGTWNEALPLKRIDEEPKTAISLS